MLKRARKLPARPGFAAASLGTIVATALLAGGAATSVAQQGPEKGTSVVVLIGDGMGPVQRTALQYKLYGKVETQPIDDQDHYGMLRTHAKGGGLVTDSAAGATAMATGVKTHRNYAGVGPDGKLRETLLEIANAQGKSTAIVEDNDVTNATLAAFAAHHDNRDNKRIIAKQYLRDTRPDLIFGGGEEVWYPKGHPGKVPDMTEDDVSYGNANLVAKAKSRGYEYAWDRKSFARLKGPKALAMTRTDAILRGVLIRKYNYRNDPYAVPEHEMVAKALEILGQNPKGFFMAIDVDEIDDAGHEHSPRLLFRSGREINLIAAELKRYQRRNPNTLVIITADHETGGLGIEAHYQMGGAGLFPVKGSGEHFRLDWTTPGHTAVNVPVTASGPDSELFDGVYDNTHVFDVASGVLRQK
ncbi:MAG: alkaline phosphatase [Solirubrobacterales bacterium]|nr:alkaline phosphatase [Solirubrobacterales bacterium]